MLSGICKFPKFSKIYRGKCNFTAAKAKKIHACGGLSSLLPNIHSPLGIYNVIYGQWKSKIVENFKKRYICPTLLREALFPSVLHIKSCCPFSVLRPSAR